MSALITELQTQLQAKLAGAKSFDASMKLALDGDVALFLNGYASPVKIAPFTNQDPDCTVSCSAALILKIFKKEADASAAFMQGELQVDGDTGAALRTLSALLGD